MGETPTDLIELYLGERIRNLGYGVGGSVSLPIPTYKGYARDNRSGGAS